MFDKQDEILRNEFPQLKDRVWLNTAAFAPHSVSVVKAMKDLMEHFHNPRIGKKVDDLFAEITNNTYIEAAKLLHCHQDDIALVINTAHGLNFPLHGIEWNEGDNIVTSQLEFPTNWMPWKYISKKRKLELREAPYNEDFHLNEQEIIELIDDKTKLVSLSLVQFNTGQRVDAKRIAKVAHEHGALISLDAIQACGGLEVYPKEMGVDFLSAGGPKFLMGPLGLGICYINPAIVESMDPPLQGTGNYNFTDHDWNDRTVSYHKGAKRFQNGTNPFYCVAGLGASIKLINSIGIDIVAENNLTLTHALYEGFEDMGLQVITPKEKTRRGALLNVRLPSKYNLEKIVEKMEQKYKVTISARFGGLRFSTQLFNTEDDVSKGLDALKQSLK